MTSKYREYREKGKRHLRNGDYTGAGGSFTTACYAKLARGDIGVGGGLRMLLVSSLCYKLGDMPDRSRNRCRQGILIAEDAKNHEVRHEPEKGILQEFVGDFRVLGELPNADEAYERATEIYESCGNPIGWNGEPLFASNMRFLRDMTKASGREPDYDSQEWQEILNTTFTARIEYKRENLEQMIYQIISDPDPELLAYIETNSRTPTDS